MVMAFLQLLTIPAMHHVYMLFVIACMMYLFLTLEFYIALDIALFQFIYYFVRSIFPVGECSLYRFHYVHDLSDACVTFSHCLALVVVVWSSCTRTI